MIPTSNLSTQNKNQQTEIDTYFGYVRMSGGKEQKNRNLSIPSQIEQIRHYVSLKQHISVTKIYEEVHSAFKGGNRPVFNKLLKELKNNEEIKGIIVFKRDRISRNPDDYLRLQKIRGDQNPIEIISISEPMINSYLGRYMIRDLQNRSILYSEELSFRVKLGHRKKLQLGGYPYNAPFGYNKHEGYLCVKEKELKIVEFVFNTFATGQYGMRKVASMVRKRYDMPKFTKGYLEHMLSNTIYYGIFTKKWNLTVEEYALFGADKPGEFIERFPIKGMQTYITKELYERCKKIARLRSPHSKRRSGVAIFPKVFQCGCSRNLKRYDKKGNRYLACTKHINLKHPLRCNERHTNLNLIDEQIELIVRSWLFTKRQRQKMLEYISNQEKELESIRNQQLTETLIEISSLKKKQNEMLLSYTNDSITKDIYQQTSSHLQEQISERNTIIKQLEKQDVFMKAMSKMRLFIKNLGKREQMIGLSDITKKSSQLYSILFKGVVNLLVTGRKIASHTSFQPFSICEVLNIQGMQG